MSRTRRAEPEPPNYNERGWWETASRAQLVEFFEELRGGACYPEESTGLIREAVAEDWTAWCQENGLAEGGEE